MAAIYLSTIARREEGGNGDPIAVVVGYRVLYKSYMISVPKAYQHWKPATRTPMLFPRLVVI